MTAVHHAPSSGKRGGTPTLRRPPRPALDAKPARREAVHWNDPEDIKLWIVALRGEIDDVIAACEDATRPQADRVLSRAETRRRLLAAETQIARLLDAGERSLDAPSAAAAP